jgi:LysM repeat protein
VVSLGLVMRGHPKIARFAAPAAFLVAATVAILLVRSGLEDGETTAAATTAANTTPATTEPGTTGTATTTATTAAGEGQFYVIEPGDTLAVIAEEHDTTVEQLLVLNPELDPVALTVGQRIRVE